MDVSYIREFNSFMRYACENGLGGRERLLWVALLFLANDRGRYNELTQTYEWPEGFFQVSNHELTLHSTLDKRGIETVRNQLRQRGLIDFMPGERKKRNPAYKINYFGLTGYKNAPKDVPNHVPNSVPKDVPNSAPIIKDIDIDVYAEYRDEDDERARARQVCACWLHTFGELLAPGAVRDLLRIAEMNGMDTALILAAVTAAGRANAKSPMEYTRSCLDDWRREGVRTEADLAEMQLLREQSREDPSAWGEVRAARERRFSREEAVAL